MITNYLGKMDGYFFELPHLKYDKSAVFLNYPNQSKESFLVSKCPFLICLIVALIFERIIRLKALKQLVGNVPRTLNTVCFKMKEVLYFNVP